MKKSRRFDIRKLVRKARENITSTRFLRFMGASASCSLLDQLLAAALFNALRNIFPDTSFLRILFANVTARIFSLTLNYSLNHRLVFSLDIDDPEWRRSSRRATASSGWSIPTIPHLPASAVQRRRRSSWIRLTCSGTIRIR